MEKNSLLLNREWSLNYQQIKWNINLTPLFFLSAFVATTYIVVIIAFESFTLYIVVSTFNT